MSDQPVNLRTARETTAKVRDLLGALEEATRVIEAAKFAGGRAAEAEGRVATAREDVAAAQRELGGVQTEIETERSRRIQALEAEVEAEHLRIGRILTTERLEIDNVRRERAAGEAGLIEARRALRRARDEARAACEGAEAEVAETQQRLANARQAADETLAALEETITAKRAEYRALLEQIRHLVPT